MIPAKNVKALISSANIFMRCASVLPCLLFLAGILGCNRSVESNSPENVQRLIQAQIDRGLEGTRTKNIDLYMSVIPEGWSLLDEAGHTVTRDELRRGVLEQWAIIEKTISIAVNVERLTLNKNEATVWTSQRWERLMHERTGPALDNVVTTERHKEQWRLVNGKWWCFRVKELGGEVYVNGKPYKE
jgi:ribosomal protein S19E (S16A)